MIPLGVLASARRPQTAGADLLAFVSAHDYGEMSTVTVNVPLTVPGAAELVVVIPWGSASGLNRHVLSCAVNGSPMAADLNTGAAARGVAIFRGTAPAAGAATLAVTFNASGAGKPWMVAVYAAAMPLAILDSGSVSTANATSHSLTLAGGGVAVVGTQANAGVPTVTGEDAGTDSAAVGHTADTLITATMDTHASPSWLAGIAYEEA